MTSIRDKFSRPRTPAMMIACAATICCFAMPAALSWGQPTAEATATSLRLASVFSDHMVLQQGNETSIWGTAEPNQEVAVEIAGRQYTTTAGAMGKWRLNVGPLEPGEPLQMTVTAGDDAVQLEDILVGEVWIASGQSNMEWPVRASNDPQKEIAAADFPQIRLLDIPHRVADKPQDAFDSQGWKVCSPENIENFSAVAYFFGRHLHVQMDVPIGLISVNWGGTQMEAWTSRDQLESSPTFAKLFGENGELTQEYQREQDRPAALFNGMLAPLVPYGIRGAIWYQGESNAGRSGEYLELSELMITDWRERWGQGDFPFLFVQLAAFEPGGESWPFLREAQLETLLTSNTGMAVAIDIGDRTDIHPRNKQEVGKRLALAARALAYEEDLIYSGPLYRSMDVKGDAIELTFDHVGGGLQARGGELKGFEIAGSDGEFVAAEATIQGDRVLVHNDQVSEPTAVRYSWSAFPDGSLYNADGLPASPFRTNR